MPELSRTERVLGPLKVGLRADLQVRRLRTRGGPRYVVHDPVSFRNHAFSIADYQVLTAIARHRSLAEVCDLLAKRGLIGDADQDRQGFFKFVMWLHSAGLLHLPITGGDQLFERQRQKTAGRRGPWYQMLMSHRIPIWNPDGFLQRTQHLVGWLFGAPGLCLWVALLATVVWKTVGRGGEMLAESTQMLTLSNLPILWVALIALKVLHEFGHAYACRRFGGAVPEMGVQMIMLTPCAYVDANASWQLRDARQRIIVALGGMYVESFVAGIAALVWAGTQPGLAHAVALNVVVLASIVTVLFNLNPLMKYDGYFVFSDLLGVFNLQQRASAFLRGWIGHFVLAQPRPRTVHTTSECWLYGLYGPAAFGFRVFLAFSLTGLMTMQWPGAGLLLGTLFGWALIVRPLMQLLNYLWNSPETAGIRTRSRLVAIATFVIGPLVFGFVPISRTVVAPGILDPRTRESIRAPVAGFVTALSTRNGSVVEPGATLCSLSNPELVMRRARLIGELEAEEVSLDVVELSDPTQAAIHRARLNYLRSSVQEIDQRLMSMQLVTTSGGTVSGPSTLELDGRFLQQGEELFQVQEAHRFLRVLFTDEDLARARLEVGSTVDVRWNCAADRPTRGVVREIRDVASRFDVPVALTMLGGGTLFASPHATGAETDEPYLHVLVEVDEVPVHGLRSGLTARVQVSARVQLLGGWVHQRMLSFVNAWRMS